MKADKTSRIRLSAARTWAATLLIPWLLSFPLSVEATSFSLDAPVNIRINGAETDNLQGYKATLSGLIGIIGFSHEEYSYDMTLLSCGDEFPQPMPSGPDPVAICTTNIDVSVTSILLELPGETIRTIIGYGVGTARLSDSRFSRPPDEYVMKWGTADVSQTLLQIVYKPENSFLGFDFGFHQFNIQGRRRYFYSTGLPPQEKSFSEDGTLIYLGLTLFFS